MHAASPEAPYTIRVHLVRHAESGLVVALSDDLRGLMVTGEDDQQIWERVPSSIKQLLEADGTRKADVSAVVDEDPLPHGFTSGSYIAQVRTEAVA